MATQQKNSGGATVTREGEKWVLLATILASSMAFIDSSALGIALPALQNDTALNVDGTQLLWISNAYTLFLAALILVGGALGDRFGRKRVFGGGIILFAAASLACGLAPSAELLILARAIQGVGGALMVPGSLSIISASFPAEKRGTAIGTWSTFGTLTTIIGPVLGGWLAGQGLWRVVFFINLPLAAIALFALITRVPESRDPNAAPRTDWLGALLVTVGLAGLTYGFTESSAQGFGSPLILGSLIGGALALILFVVVEARIQYPMVPLALFKDRTFSGTNLLTLFLYAALSATLFFFPLNLIQVQGYPESAAGFANLPFALMLVLLSRQAGKLADRIGARPLLIVGPAITAIGFLLLARPGLTNGVDDYWTTFFPAAIALGIGMGITVAPLTTAVMSSAPQERAGTASGINNAVARVAGVLAIAILGAVALTSFTNNLTAQVATLEVSEEARAALIAESSRLADAEPPEGLDETQTAAARETIQGSFVQTFNLIAVISAILAAISSVMAALLVTPKPRGESKPQGQPEGAQPVRSGA